MASFGAFTANADGSFSGSIRTLTLSIRSVTIRPIEKTGKGPDYRVLAGKADLGAGWKKVSKDEADYISIELDDPSFDKPMNTALVATPDGYALVWSRPKARPAEVEED